VVRFRVSRVRVRVRVKIRVRVSLLLVPCVARTRYV